MYTAKSVEDAELVYSILKSENPGKQIKVVYSWELKEYDLTVTSDDYTNDPEIPLDLSMKVVYGDSVTEDTPIMAKYDHGDVDEMITIKSIKELFEGYSKIETTIYGKEEVAVQGLHVYSNKKWNKVQKIIRHKSNKRLFNIHNHLGFVTVTEDHSLLTSRGQEIKPEDCTMYTKLLTCFPNSRIVTIKDDGLHSDSAYALGVILKCGQNNTVRFKNGIKEFGECPSVNRIPDIILNARSVSIISFLTGYFGDAISSNSFTLQIEDKVMCMGFYYLFRRVGFSITILDSSTLYISDEIYPEPLSVLYTRNCREDEYVYDIQTELGCFHAGIGEFIVKNTDSIFIEMKYNREDYNQNREDTFKIAAVCGEKLTNEVFNRRPIEMEFEKVFQPFILLTKKRYIGKKYDDLKDCFKLKDITAAGIAMTRRDYCDFVKDCYKGVIDHLVTDADVDAAIHVYKKTILALESYSVDVSKFVVSAQLAKEYKTMPVHVVLANKLKARNEEVQVGDRIPYVFIENQDPKIKKSELGEDPDYVRKNNLKINRWCYLEQLAKPLLGFFKVVLKDDESKMTRLVEFTNEKMISFGGKKMKQSDFILPSNSEE